MPHSPQRPEAGSIGLVFERPREPGTLEHFQWYCPDCNALIHDVELQVSDIVVDLPPVFEAFYASDEARTCGECGMLRGSTHISPGPIVTVWRPSGVCRSTCMVPVSW